jgi:hypothetical protein
MGELYRAAETWEKHECGLSRIRTHDFSVAAVQIMHAIERAANVAHLFNICLAISNIYRIVHIKWFYSLFAAI